MFASSAQIFSVIPSHWKTFQIESLQIGQEYGGDDY